MMKQRRSFLCLLFAFSATFVEEGLANDLEVGTAFGANWKEAEYSIREKVISALEDVRDNCSSEALCPSSEVREFCGYNDNERTYVYHHDEHVVPHHYERKVARSIFHDTQDLERVRHAFDAGCEYSRMGPGCYFELCLSTCFEHKKTLSNECIESIYRAEFLREALHAQEESGDQRELFYRISIPLMGLLSMLSSILTVCLHRHKRLQADSRSDENNVSTWEKCCITLDVVSSFALLGIVVFFCPLLLVVLVPPYALVQLVYYAFFAEVPDETHNEADYRLLEDAGCEIDRRDTLEVLPVVV